MVKFHSLTLKNFLSYGNNATIVDLNQAGTTFIVGEDLDNTTNGRGANGVGKTVILNALSYAVYDKAVSNISKDKLVNNINKKNLEVTVTFEAKGKYYHIKRVRKSKNYAAGNYVQLFRNDEKMEFNDEHDITPDSVSNTNKYIEKIIGIPYELFVRIVVFSATNTPFLDLPVRHVSAPNQTSFIEELFDLTSLTEKAELLKTEIKATETDLTFKSKTISHLEKEHERHSKQIESAKLRVVNWERTRVADIKAIQKKLDLIEGVDVEGQRQLHNEKERINGELNNALEGLRKIEKEVRSTDKKTKAAKNELEHLQDNKCPYCLQQYVDANDKMAELAATISSGEQRVADLSSVIEDVDTLIETLTKSLKKVEEQLTNDVEELLDITNKSASLKEKIADLENAVNPFIEPMDELEAMELDPINYDEVNELNVHLEHQKLLLKLLTKKDSFVRKTLLNKNIPYLNSKLQGYLTDLGLPHVVEFTHELTAKISRFGRELDFGNLSAGQRARVNLALSFAFGDVLTKLHSPINVCMLDEALDVGLNTIGVQAAAKMIKHKARDENLSLYIISHRDEIDGAFDNTMTIQMSKGFSYLKEE